MDGGRREEKSGSEGGSPEAKVAPKNVVEWRSNQAVQVQLGKRIVPHKRVQRAKRRKSRASTGEREREREEEGRVVVVVMVMETGGVEKVRSFDFGPSLSSHITANPLLAHIRYGGTHTPVMEALSLSWPPTGVGSSTSTLLALAGRYIPHLPGIKGVILRRGAV